MDDHTDTPFILIVEAAAIEPGAARSVEIDGARLLVCNVDGNFHVLDDECTHDRSPLDTGVLEGCIIECPRHGARFDVRDGSVVALPATRPIAVYESRLAGGVVEARFKAPERDPFGF